MPPGATEWVRFSAHAFLLSAPRWAATPVPAVRAVSVSGPSALGCDDQHGDRIHPRLLPTAGRKDPANERQQGKRAIRTSRQRVPVERDASARTLGLATLPLARALAGCDSSSGVSGNLTYCTKAALFFATTQRERLVHWHCWQAEPTRRRNVSLFHRNIWSLLNTVRYSCQWMTAADMASIFCARLLALILAPSWPHRWMSGSMREAAW